MKASKCVKCDKGSVAIKGQSVCAKCSGNEAPNADNSECQCKVGYYHSGLACGKCPVGSISPSVGNQRTCKHCSVHQVPSNNGRECVTCPSGFIPTTKAPIWNTNAICTANPGNVWFDKKDNKYKLGCTDKKGSIVDVKGGKCTKCPKDKPHADELNTHCS